MKKLHRVIQKFPEPSSILAVRNNRRIFFPYLNNTRTSLLTDKIEHLSFAFSRYGAYVF